MFGLQAWEGVLRSCEEINAKKRDKVDLVELSHVVYVELVVLGVDEEKIGWMAKGDEGTQFPSEEDWW